QYKVVASVGHFRDLPRKEMGVAAPDYRPRYEITKPEVVKRLRSAVRGNRVLLATDPDREGESIAWHLQQTLNLPGAERVTFQEITREALQQALAHPRPIDANLVRAQEARRVLDRLVGYRVSGMLRDLTGQALSAGRVQTPAVRLVVEREREIQAFQPVTHYGVEAGFESDGLAWTAKWDFSPWLANGEKHWLDAAYAQEVAQLRHFQVADIETHKKSTRPPAPFTTSTLQQSASAQLKLRPKKTMDLAQQLFAAGLITYHRTDSPNLSDEAIGGGRDHLAATGLADYVPSSPNRWKSKAGAQEAHEAIRPTHIDKTDITQEADDPAAARLYQLIWRRTIASQMKNAEDQQTTVTLESQETTPDGRRHAFIATGNVERFDGWRRILRETDKESKALPPLRNGQLLEAGKCELLEKRTKPPARYTEATLIKALERRGIGRPSTYASIMETLHARSYVIEKKRHLVPAEPAFAVIDALRERFEFAEYDYTRDIEARLDEIARGRYGYRQLVAQVDKRLDEELRRLSSLTIGNTPTHACPECGSPLRKRKGKKGWFWGCSGYPECRYTAPDNQGKPGERRPPQAAANKHQAGEPCPKCGKGSLVLRTLKKGKNQGKAFLGCSGFPGCDFFSWAA
ncbi:MAG TPA: type I DNA topoisomerase, partial [Chromatiaceae bacterium]|nr:type I DNA topoisomerase [Chromatiaceae bacterium]